MNVIHEADCIGPEGMRLLPDKSIDMILCDLPYGTTACAWDTIIPFEPLWEQYKRVIKGNAAIVLTASQPFTSLLVCSNLKMFRYEWVWLKRPVNFLNANNQPLRKTERILVFGGKIYNPQGLIYAPRVVKARKKSELYGEHGKEKESLWTNYPTDVLEFIGECDLHPTQKPVELFEYLIKTYTNPGDTVLDNCMGSGTTAVACIRTGRNYIGYENDPVHFKNAVKRAAETELIKVENGPLFGKQRELF